MAEWLLFYLQLKMLSASEPFSSPKLQCRWSEEKITKEANCLNLRNHEKGHGYKVTESPPTCSSLLE